MFIIIFLILIAGFFVFALLTGFLISAPKYRGPVSDHFDGRRFTNPRGIKAGNPGKVIQWMLHRERGPWIELKDVVYGEKPAARIMDGLCITFVNHSTFLIQVDGLNILTDPIWSKRTSPVEWAGPKRMRPPGIRRQDLPKIDLILLSHNHWDHLDIRTLKELNKVHHPKIVTPLGVGQYLQQAGIQTLNDVDWWTVVEINKQLTVEAVPAQHFSGRGMFDRDATLWCGYVIRREKGNIYFAGDTGYNPETFVEIGQRCSPIAVSLVPIGAYKPEWFMSPIHCSPSESVKIHREVKTQVSIASHFGTFPLADDGENEPAAALNRALKEAGIDSSKFLILEEGKAFNGI